MKPLLALTLLTLAARAAPQFEFRDITPESVELREGASAVYVYHHGAVHRTGAPAELARCCYLHPVYTPAGTVVTDDFPDDHYHHRGIFWAWPVVVVGKERIDGWTLRGLRPRFARWLAREATSEKARLAVENVWTAGGRPVVRETVEIAAFPARDGRRELDFRLAFEAIGDPVELRGEPAEAKGYGGFSVRFAPREETVILTEVGRESADSNMVPHRWAALEAVFSGRRAGLRIEIDPAHPGFPNGWCLRHYGFLGVNYPGLTRRRLEPGRPLELRYKVTLSDLSP